MGLRVFRHVHLR